MQTAYDLVWLAAQRSPDQQALVDDISDRAFSYRELIDELDAITAGLAERGVTAGMRVATVLGNQIEHGLVLLALARLGAVPALLNARLAPVDLAKLIEQGELAGAVIMQNDELAKTIAGALPDGAPLLSVGGDAGPAEDFARCRGDVSALPPVPRPDPDELAFLFYTSGTTGLPKGVMIPHRATEHRLYWVSTQAGFRHGAHTRALGFMPLSHAIGFYAVFLITLAYGGTYFVQSAFDPVKSVDIIERHGISYMFAVPTLYHAITKAPNYAAEKMKSLDLVLWGGGNIEPRLYDHIGANWPCTLRHIYGTTETMCSGHNPDPTPDTLTTLRAGMYTVARVIELDGGVDDVVERGGEGELIVDAQADTIFTGYLNRPDATAEKLRDGWYFTGDVVRLEENGDFTLMGRVDDMIRSGGESIHPEEIEAILDDHPAVAETSVIGVPDPDWGQLVVACVVPGEGKKLSAVDLDRHCLASTLAPFKRPRGYVFYDQALPRNAANKVLRRILRAGVESARENGAAPGFEVVGKAS